MSDCNCNSSTTVKPATICPTPPLQNFQYNTPNTATQEIALRSLWLTNQGNTELDTQQFTTNPTVPYNTGADVGELRTNTAATKIFNTINQRKQSGTLFGTGCPVFRTQQEKIQYIQAQYTQPTGFAGGADRVKLGINTLFA
jgi:hypothetical protein